MLTTPVSGFSRTFDDGGPSPALDNQESPGKRGPLSRLAALHHQKCRRTAIWHALHALDGTVGVDSGGSDPRSLIQNDAGDDHPPSPPLNLTPPIPLPPPPRPPDHPPRFYSYPSLPLSFPLRPFP